jgi:hypothetical protein
MDIWYTAMGLHKTIKQTKQKKIQKFQYEILRLITVVCLQPYSP